ARIVPAICGIAMIPLLWIAARSLEVARGTAYAATIFIALSPLHVDYSREGRPYAMIVLIAAALMIVVLRGESMRAVVLLLVAAFYTTALIAPFILALAVSAFLTGKRRVATASIICLALMALCYHPGSAPAGQRQFPQVTTQPIAWLFFLLAIVGA